LGIIKKIISTINIDVAKRRLTQEEIKLVQSIKDNTNVNTKDILTFVSKFCNYDFFKKDLNYADLIFANANFSKLPVYNPDGDLVWPKKMSHEEVKKFVEERDKEKEEKNPPQPSFKKEGEEN